MEEKDFLTFKFLQKLKDTSLDAKHEPLHKDLAEFWAQAMTMRGLIQTLNYFGWEIRKKDVDKT